VQENPSHLPPKRWDGENFRPTYPGGTDFWLAAALPLREAQAQPALLMWRRQGSVIGAACRAVAGRRRGSVERASKRATAGHGNPSGMPGHEE
jgi:hypothetical protein